MSQNGYLGEFEQMLLLAIMQGGENAHALAVRRQLEDRAGRTVSKGAFYTTLDRLESKGFVKWASKIPEEGRRGLPQRHFRVTPEGVDELRKSRSALVRLWSGLEETLDSP